MTVKDDILHFLREPSAFSRFESSGPVDHVAALEAIVEPAIQAAGDKPLRPAQVEAWRGLGALRSGLVLGPPGTGKTHLLSWLVLGHVWARQEAGRHGRAFLTAFTRSAIETLLRAVAKRASKGPNPVELVYLGAAPEEPLPPNVFVVELKDRDRRGELLRLLSAPGVVVGGTVWQMARLIEMELIPLEDRMTSSFFDLIAIDEASQIMLSQSLMVLAGLAPDGRVIVSGDDKQLPPIQAIGEVMIDGRAVGGSLYAFLKQQGVPEFALRETFRLNEPLTAFPKAKFYGEAYESAPPVADRRLSLRQNWQEGLQPWEAAVLDPDHPVAVIVHDGPTAATEAPSESALASHLVSLLRSRLLDDQGHPLSHDLFWSDGLALVSPHRAQNRALRRQLREGDDAPFAETVDRIQGKERDAVILSYTVSDVEFALAEAQFIFSPERLNVATTRARSKLIVIVSRALLATVPLDQTTLDKAELLRNFVFDCERLWTGVIEPGSAPPLPIELRVRAFDATQLRPLINDVDLPPRRVPDVEILDPRLEKLREIVGRVALTDRRGLAFLDKIGRQIGARDPFSDVLADLVKLHHAGWIDLKLSQNDHWYAVPVGGRRRLISLDDPAIMERILQALPAVRASYITFRALFAWMDECGKDLLRPLIESLPDLARIVVGDYGQEIIERAPPPATPPLPPVEPALQDQDFRVLNALEDLEKRRIDVGLFELWSSHEEVANAAGIALADASRTLGALSRHGYVLLADEGRVRSRMAELARVLRHVKQRFGPQDAADRPYLVRSVKVEIQDRRKPDRDQPLDAIFDRARRAAPSDAARQALAELDSLLHRIWGQNPKLAGFQTRALEAIFAAWTKPADVAAMVIAADTGAGKTEAGLFPLIAGAALDMIEGRDGVRAILAYPRVRLASNQAQRIARYLAAADSDSMIGKLSVGLQFGEVPRSWVEVGDRKPEDAKGWHRSGEDWAFPLFGCPHDEGELRILPGRGLAGADELSCTQCGWRFNRWVGTKEAIWHRPPSFFIPTVDSLHQWMHDVRCATVFGDGAIGPRAMLADEIHLYAATHGAQVAQTFRRLLNRMRVNGGGAEPIAIGMSATLGEPGEAFGRMLGREAAAVIRPLPEEASANPRGREYFYFIQPEIESRDRDVAGAATAIQSIMALAHGMRRRTGDEGGYRSLVFLDSIDKVRRLHADYTDAEKTKKLEGLRTVRYPDDAVTGEPRSQCCGDPANCTIFNDGECWIFAARDERQVYAADEHWLPGRPLAVAERPVTSQTSEGAERMIKRSDVIFATSSLEVGYDDPDITFVFQHYAPQNLASFIQRKGRGGRGLDDRPTTAITLSLYAPRDTYWFNHPESMLDASGFRAPLNADNHFVRRGQMLCLILDAVAAVERRTGRAQVTSDGMLSAEAEACAKSWVERSFGPNCWREQGFDDLGAFWRRALPRDNVPAVVRPQVLRTAVGWIPKFLSAPISLPQVDVLIGSDKPLIEDIALGFNLAAPGNISRRFSAEAGFWRPPTDGHAPWFTPEDYRKADWIEAVDGSLDDLLRQMPVDARPHFQDGAETKIIRPSQMTLEKAGDYGADPDGDGWRPTYFVDDGGVLHREEDGARHRVDAKSRGELRSFTIVQADQENARSLEGGDLGQAFRTRAFWSVPGAVPPTTGLRASRVSWGADVEIIRKLPRGRRGRPPEPLHWQHVFTDPRSGQPALHGYVLETEGLQIKVDREALDSFVEAEFAGGLSTDLRLAQAQTFITMRLQAANMNRFQSALLGRLTGIAWTSGAYDADFRTLTGRRWSPEGLAQVLRSAKLDRLRIDPLSSEQRLGRAIDGLMGTAAGVAMRAALRAIDSPELARRHLRSVVLHSLALRLRLLFALVAQGDERHLLTHVKLPVVYEDDGDDTITIAEVGEFGDGTTRAFAARWSEAVKLWHEGFAVHCPNAEEDRVIDLILSRPDRHDAWKALNPRRAGDMESLRQELSAAGPMPALPPSVTRLVFGELEVGATRQHKLDVAAAIWRLRADLEAAWGRRADGWEVASRVMALIENGSAEESLNALFAGYGSIAEIQGGDGTRAPAERFAEQVYRLGHRLCADGCRACVQQDSDLLSGDLTRTTVSRSILGRFLASAC